MAKPSPNIEASPETIAIEALSFIASDARLFDRFCGLTGLSAGDMRTAATEPGFLSGVLDFITAHEATLLAFSQESGRPPNVIVNASDRLPGARLREWTNT